jgi:hypothetical protein
MITSPNTNKVYIGATTKTLKERLKGHKSDHAKYKNDKRDYMTSFEILEAGDYTITLIEDVNCETVEELNIRERYHIENTPDCVNKQHPGRTKKEYIEENKDKIKEHTKEYRVKNKEVRKVYDKNYRAENQDKIKKYKEDHKDEKAVYNKNYRADNLDAVKAAEKKYKDEHKEEQKAYNTDYYQKNKDTIAVQRSQKVLCECGGEYSQHHKARHLKTKRHIEGIATKNTNQT